MSWINRRTIVVFVGLLTILELAACSGGSTQPSVKIELAPASLLPPEVQRAKPKVREAYQYAVANQGYLANFPCYCGCGAMGHKSNLDCYIDEMKADGTILFDNHAFF